MYREVKTSFSPSPFIVSHARGCRSDTQCGILSACHSKARPSEYVIHTLPTATAHAALSADADPRRRNAVQRAYKIDHLFLHGGIVPTLTHYRNAAYARRLFLDHRRRGARVAALSVLIANSVRKGYDDPRAAHPADRIQQRTQLILSLSAIIDLCGLDRSILRPIISCLLYTSPSPRDW